MDFGNSVDSATQYLQSHVLIGAALVLALIVLIYFKPKAMFKLAVASAILIAVLYVLMFLINLTETGVRDQDKFLDKPRIDMKDQ